MPLTATDRTVHTNTREYIFFSEPQETFLKTDYILRHTQKNLNTYSKNYITPSITSDHHGLQLDVNNRKMETVLTHRNLATLC